MARPQCDTPFVIVIITIIIIIIIIINLLSILWYSHTADHPQEEFIEFWLWVREESRNF